MVELMGVKWLTGILSLVPMLTFVTAFVWSATGMNPIQQMFAEHKKDKDE